MPLYVFRCRKGHDTELLQRFDAEPPPGCSICGEPVERVLFPTAIHFHGSGFHNTTYPSSGRRHVS